MYALFNVKYPENVISSSTVNNPQLRATWHSEGPGPEWQPVVLIDDKKFNIENPYMSTISLA